MERDGTSAVFRRALHLRSIIYRDLRILLTKRSAKISPCFQAFCLPCFRKSSISNTSTDPLERIQANGLVCPKIGVKQDAGLWRMSSWALALDFRAYCLQSLRYQRPFLCNAHHACRSPTSGFALTGHRLYRIFAEA